MQDQERREYDREYYRKNPNKFKRYRQVHKAKRGIGQELYRRANPEKIWCRNVFNRAVRNGLLIPQSCEGCGSKNNIHGHHDDYTKPLEVRWLCSSCHGIESRLN